jgi:hypothetical protein
LVVNTVHCYCHCCCLYLRRRLCRSNHEAKDEDQEQDEEQGPFNLLMPVVIVFVPVVPFVHRSFMSNDYRAPSWWQFVCGDDHEPIGRCCSATNTNELKGMTFKENLNLFY